MAMLNNQMVMGDWIRMEILQETSIKSLAEILVWSRFSQKVQSIRLELRELHWGDPKMAKVVRLVSAPWKKSALEGRADIWPCCHGWCIFPRLKLLALFGTHGPSHLKFLDAPVEFSGRIPAMRERRLGHYNYNSFAATKVFRRARACHEN